MIKDIQGIIKKKSSGDWSSFDENSFKGPSIESDHSFFVSRSFKVMIQHTGEISHDYTKERNITVFYLGNIFFRKNNETDKLGPVTSNELINHYLNTGIDILELLKGSFLLFIFDEVNHKYYFCNDKLGFYELFYFENSELIYFSTDLSAFNNNFKLNVEIDPISVFQFFLFDYPLSDFSLMKGVKTILPGNAIIINNNELEVTEYSSYLNALMQPIKLTWDETYERIPSEFNLAVDTLISGKNKICAGLTSGFDSRANLSRLVKHHAKDILYYSWGLPKSIELKIAKEVTKAFNLNYKIIHLTEDFESKYEFYAHQSVMLSNGKGPITRANHAYGYHLLTKHSNLFLTGLIGSELLKPRNCGGYMFTQLFLDLLNQDSQSVRSKILEQKFESIDFLQQKALSHFKTDFINRTLGYFGDYDIINETHKRLYYFMLRDGFRNYFGHEIHANRIYGQINSPYADDDFISFLLGTPIPDLNKDAFKNKLSTKLKGTRLYIPILETNLSRLLKINTGRYLKPEALNSPFLYLHLLKAYVKSKISAKNDTFDSKRWSRNLLYKNKYIMDLHNDIFLENQIDESDHKNMVKLYSIKYFYNKNELF